MTPERDGSLTLDHVGHGAVGVDAADGVGVYRVGGSVEDETFTGRRRRTEDEGGRRRRTEEGGGGRENMINITDILLLSYT